MSRAKVNRGGEKFFSPPRLTFDPHPYQRCLAQHRPELKGEYLELCFRAKSVLTKDIG